MAFNTTLLKALETGSSPVILNQLNIPEPWQYFILDSAGIWKFSTLTNVYTGIDTEVTENFPLLDTIAIGQVIVDGASLPEITSYTNTIDGRATALAGAAGFIFDGPNDILYCRFNTNYDPPLALRVSLGIILPSANKAYYDYVNDINYSPDLKNTPGMKTSKDPLFFDKVKLNQFTQNFNNVDYRFDDKKDAGIFNGNSVYFLGTTDLAFSFFEKIYTGKVSKYTYTPGLWNLSIKDGRSGLTNTIPPNFANQTTYPDMDDYGKSTPLPLLYGKITGVRCISLDEEASPANFRFAFADINDFNVDVTGAIIKVNGVITTASVAPSGTTGIFSIATANYSKGQIVTYSADGGIIDGSTLTNQLDIAKHLIVNYAGIPFDANRFNLVEWAAETLTAPDSGLAIVKRSTVLKSLELLQKQNLAGFIVQLDGLLTWRTFDSTADPVIQIKQTDWIGQIPDVVGDAEQVLSSATIKYDQDLTAGRWTRAIDTDSEVIVGQSYGIEKNKEFDTNHVTEAEALVTAGQIMDKSATVQNIFTGTVPLWFFDAEIGLNAEIEVDRPNGVSWFGVLKCEILEVDPNISAGQLTIVFRAFESLGAFTANKRKITEAGLVKITEDGLIKITEERF